MDFMVRRNVDASPEVPLCLMLLDLNWAHVVHLEHGRFLKWRHLYRVEESSEPYNMLERSVACDIFRFAGA